MMHTTAQALGRAHLAELHRQAQRDALARAARQARHARQTPPAQPYAHLTGPRRRGQSPGRPDRHPACRAALSHAAPP